MTSAPREEETQEKTSTLDRLWRVGVMNVASGGMATGIDHVLAGTHGIDVTGLGGANVDDGSVLHHGPDAGGEALDRPSAGYLAHASATNGVSLERAGDVSGIARDIDAAGTFSIGGMDIDVMDYLPGGDMVQLAAGNADPGQILMRLAEHGVETHVRRGDADGPGIRSRGEDTHGNLEGGSAHAHARGRAGDADARRPDADERVASDDDATPDADQDARDRERLAALHRLDLDTAVETSDAARVHTEIHARGRTIEVDTDFEARLPDNREEREEAAEHVDHLAHAPSDVVSHEQPGMRMRSVIAAHLDARARDEGMSI